MEPGRGKGEGLAGLKEAIISRVYGAYYAIRPLDDLEREIRGRLRGKLRLEKSRPEHSKSRHLLIVGDRVSYSMDTGQARDKSEEAIIHELLDRRNAVFRASPYEEHALGANLDRAIVVMSVSSPPHRQGFLDRFLASCHSGNVTPCILFTKIDLLDSIGEDERDDALELMALYEHLGYDVFRLDQLNMEIENDESFKTISDTISHGTTLLAGNSGTGKSTFLNHILGHEIQKTNDVSDSSGKGKHTTTNSSLFLHPNGRAMIIDTPGVKEWGVNHLSREDIILSFPELSDRASECKFRNCDHSEGVDGCAVQEAIEKSIDAVENDEDDWIIHPNRLKSLYSIIESLENPDRVRTGDYIKPTGRLRNQNMRPYKK